MKKKRQHEVYVETIGPSESRRFRIASRKRGYWTGKGWDQAPEEALLYCRFQHAAQDLHGMTIVDNLDKPARCYQANVTVVVFGDEPVDLEDLQTYLSHSTKLSLLEPGPGQEGITQVEINWDTLHPAE